MEWAVALQVEKADRETLEQMYGALTRLLVHALSPAGAGTDLARALPRDRLAALAQLAETKYIILTPTASLSRWAST